MNTLNSHTVARTITYTVYDESSNEEKEFSAQLTEGNGGILTLYTPEGEVDISIADVPFVVKVLKEFC